jgi:hypothetical protein
MALTTYIYIIHEGRRLCTMALAAMAPPKSASSDFVPER